MKLDYYVYHIGLKGMTIDEGYIGITNNPLRRWKQHCRAKTHVGNAIRKYGEDNVFLTIIKCTTEQRALEIEEQLRPLKEIGWNISEGGGKPPGFKGYRHSKEAIQKLRLKQAGVLLTDEIKCKIAKSKSKAVNIYSFETGLLIGQASSITDYARENGYDISALNRTANGKQRKHKGIYARYIGE